jgi:MFS transporter, PPP family, 3-phenylpropionic acid transporter
MVNSVPLAVARPRRMWAVWVSYFFQFAAVGIFTTFLNVYFRDQGFSGTQIGLLNMLSGIVGLVSVVAWGYLGDRTGKPRFIIAGGAVGAFVAVQFIPYVHGFWPILLAVCVGSLMNAAPMTLVDSTTLVLLGARREDYGRYRLGGSLGYILMTLGSGFVLQGAGTQVMFPLYGAVMAAFALAALLLPPAAVHLEQPGLKQIGVMVRQPVWLLFISCVFLTWIGYYATIMFLGVSLKAMGAGDGLIGIATIISAVVEMPFMFFSGAFLRRFGPVRLLAAAMALMVLRYFLLSQMPSPGWAVAINVLNGPAFVFFWNSAVTYANKLAPPSMAGTAQGLYTAATSLGGVVSSLLAGWLFDVVGPKGIFLVLSALVLVALVLFSAGTLVRKRSQP